MSLSFILRISPDNHNITWREMSDTESVKGESSEDKMEEIDDDFEKVLNGEEKDIIVKNALPRKSAGP